jgi:23S rRNA (adenine2503-C2)-methyltransferase
MAKALIYDQNLSDFESLLESWGEPSYRAKQVWQGIYHQLWYDAQQFTTLSIALRDTLNSHFTYSHLRPTKLLESADGETRKTLFYLPDGKAVETVLMRYRHRRTLCISTQAGCAMGCVFCATGQMGFQRNLTSGEIVEQVLYYAIHLRKNGNKVTNIVVMGMGEPFHNYDSTMAAIDRLNHPDGFNLGARRFTISTVGIVPAIKRFTTEKRQVNLAVSLHAVDDDLRSSMLPINRKYPVRELLSSCEEYVRKTGRRITFEWALIRGVNDSQGQAQELADKLQVFRRRGSTLCHVNIIPLNPTRQYQGEPTSHQQALIFQDELERNNIPCSIRLRRGIDIEAGCGQLAAEIIS